MKMILVTKPMNRGLTKEEIGLLNSGEEILYVFGRIEYRDIFHVVHLTTFCMQATPDLANFTDCSTYNDAN